MRNLIPILLAVVILSSGCDPDGYSCNSEGCYADNDTPQYQTLDDCNSICEEQIPGGCGSLVLYDYYLYSTVQIGDQCWFAENCRYLPEVSPSSEVSTKAPYYHVYDYQGTDVEAAKLTENYQTYGVLYNWPAVMTEGICPVGWHIPTDEDFTELTDYLGGVGVAGGKMKEAGYEHWNSPNTGATNSSGFNGLPGGFASTSGFNYNGATGVWWSSTESADVSGSRVLVLWDGSESVQKDNSGQEDGLSARCVQD